MTIFPGLSSNLQGQAFGAASVSHLVVEVGSTGYGREFDCGRIREAIGVRMGWYGGRLEGGEGEIRKRRGGGRLAFKSYNEKGVNWV